MEHRIDIHSHSKHSDGVSTVLEMALKCRDLGYSACVITDHDRPHSYYESRVEAKWVSRMIQYPIIVGCEVSTRYGHCLLFGKKAIEAWYREKEALNRIDNIDDWCEHFKENVTKSWIGDIIEGQWIPRRSKDLNYAMILNHPRGTDAFFENMRDSFFRMLSGFEVVNGTEDYRETKPEMVEVIRKRFKEVGKQAKEFKNSDSHSVGELGRASNKIAKRITNEENLILWINGKR